MTLLPAPSAPSQRAARPLAGVVLALLALVPPGLAQAPGAVLGHQKVSATAGGFTGTLDPVDAFGSGLATLGDLDGDGVVDLAVGALGDDDGGSFSLGTGRGAVWILFLHADGSVKSQQKISSTEGGFGQLLDDDDRFGWALGPLGDQDGDGVEDLAVGARWDDDGGVNRGAVWILLLNTDGTVKASQKISATAGGFAGALDNLDEFGSGLAGLGDLDGDGKGDLAVGALGDDDGGLDRGAVWILFLNTDGTVKSHQKISSLAGGLGGALADGDAFGVSAAALGDLDGDGIGDLAVGARLDDGGGVDRGAAWVLFLDDDGTVQASTQIADGLGGFSDALADFEQLGTSVAGLGDLDRDGLVDLAAGANHNGDGGTKQGAVRVLFLESDGSVKSSQRISETAGGFTGVLDPFDEFGISLASLGDLDGDGRGDLATGALWDDDGAGTEQGAVWMLFLDAAAWIDLGGGTAGANGTPELRGIGSLTEGSLVTLELTQGPSSDFILLWISVTSSPFAALGGTVHAVPFAAEFLLGTDASGTFVASTGWPPGLPPDTSAWFQFLCQDFSVPAQITLSNGLKATTP